MVYLVHVTFKYYDFYYKFECLENAIAFIEQLKLALVLELSEDLTISTTIEALTKDEFAKKIEKTKGE